MSQKIENKYLIDLNQQFIQYYNPKLNIIIQFINQNIETKYLIILNRYYSILLSKIKDYYSLYQPKDEN